MWDGVGETWSCFNLMFQALLIPHGRPYTSWVVDGDKFGGGEDEEEQGRKGGNFGRCGK